MRDGSSGSSPAPGSNRDGDGNKDNYDEAEINAVLEQLHEKYLRDNIYDEGDLIYYRINYRIQDAFKLSGDQASNYHKRYHEKSPRRVSQGYCDSCDKIVTIIPIIYGILPQDMDDMQRAQSEGRIIIGNIDKIKKGAAISMFGCRQCRADLPKYGVMR